MRVSELRVEGEHHEERVNEKRKINNFTPELRMTPSKEKSTNREIEEDEENKVDEMRKINNFTPELGMTPSKEKSTNSESEGDDERINDEKEKSNEKIKNKNEKENDEMFHTSSKGRSNHEEKVIKRERVNNYTPRIRDDFQAREKSTNRESEGDDDSKPYKEMKSQVKGDDHEEKVNEKGKIHNFTLEFRMTQSKEKLMNKESEGDDERMTPSKEKSDDKDDSEGDDESKP
ncbi:hypothetical protein Tco_0083735 [Tanacetum coccineum]